LATENQLSRHADSAGKMPAATFRLVDGQEGLPVPIEPAFSTFGREGLPVPRSRRCWQAEAGCRSAASIE